MFSVERIKFLRNRDPFDLNTTKEENDIVEDLICEFGDEENDAKFDEAFKKLKETYCPLCREVHPTKDDVKDFLHYNHLNIRESLVDLKKEFTMFIFNKKIKIEKSKIQIKSDRIVFDEKIPTVNFASCQYSIEDESGLNQEDLYISGYANIPPIPYVVYDEGYHLKIELFNNGFVRDDQFEFQKYSF